VDTRLRAASSEIEPVMGQGNPSNLKHTWVWVGLNPSSIQSGRNVSEAGHASHLVRIGELDVLPEPPASMRGE